MMRRTSNPRKPFISSLFLRLCAGQGFFLLYQRQRFYRSCLRQRKFLMETYLSLRCLENESILPQYQEQILMGFVINPLKVDISQFYSIEINEFAVTVAKTVLWIAERQRLHETKKLINHNTIK